MTAPSPITSTDPAGVADALERRLAMTKAGNYPGGALGLYAANGEPELVIGLLRKAARDSERVEELEEENAEQSELIRQSESSLSEHKAVMEKMAEALKELYRFAGDAPGLDFGEDVTLSWLAIWTEKARSALSSYTALSGGKDA